MIDGLNQASHRQREVEERRALNEAPPSSFPFGNSLILPSTATAYFEVAGLVRIRELVLAFTGMRGLMDSPHTPWVADMESGPDPVALWAQGEFLMATTPDRLF